MYKCFLLVIFSSVAPIRPQACPDRWALQNVSAWTVYDPKDRSSYQESINFYTLDDYTAIHLKTANVSVLCDGMVKDFRRLRNLALSNANISKILPEAFQQLPKLVSLSLAVNRITTVNKYQFRNLRRLRVLYLSSNRIEDIKEDAFSELVNLEKIYLDKNRLWEIDEQWFLKNLRLSYINLAYNNVSKLQSGAFTLPKSSSVQIHLQNNNIEQVEPNAVVSEGEGEEEPSLILRLDNNDLTEIPANFLTSLDKFRTTLTVNSNNIKCIYNDVLETLKDISVEVYVFQNPIDCPCMDVIRDNLSMSVLRAKFNFTTTNDCPLFRLVPPEYN